MNFYNNELYRKDLATAINQTIGFEDLKEKSVIITGATGLIGSFLVEALMYSNEMFSNNINVYAVGRSKERLMNRFNSFACNKYFHPIEQDINKPLTFDFSANYIIHAASNAHPFAFSTDPVGTILSNIVGTYQLLEYAYKVNTERFLFISSGEVYGENQEDKLSEEFSGYVNPISPRSCYPTSKRAAENLCVSFAKQYGLYTTIARLCHTYGPNVTPTDNRASVQFINQALKGETIVLKSQGIQKRSYCYIADSASGILSVLLKGHNSTAYNVANTSSIVTVAELAKEIARQANTNIVFQLRENTLQPQETPITHAILDAKKLEDLGWKGQYGISQGINHTLSILKNILL